MIAGISHDDHAGSYIFNYIIYVVLAFVMAGFAGLYVTALAPYASGSGIPEVRVRIVVCRFNWRIKLYTVHRNTLQI